MTYAIALSLRKSVASSTIGAPRSSLSSAARSTAGCVGHARGRLRAPEAVHRLIMDAIFGCCLSRSSSARSVSISACASFFDWCGRPDQAAMGESMGVVVDRSSTSSLQSC